LTQLQIQDFLELLTPSSRYSWGPKLWAHWHYLVKQFCHYFGLNTCVYNTLFYPTNSKSCMDLRAGDKLLWCVFHVMGYSSKYLSPSCKKKCSFSLFTLKECWIFDPNPTNRSERHIDWQLDTSCLLVLSQRASREFPKYLTKAYQYFLFVICNLQTPYAFIINDGFHSKKYA